nr:glycine cleavage system h protein 2, mitochondrial [Quercus suber]
MASRLLWASRAASYLRISAFHGGFASVVKDLKYLDSHEWVKVEGNSATVGIINHAQDHLGKLVEVMKSSMIPLVWILSTLTLM